MPLKKSQSRNNIKKFTLIFMIILFVLFYNYLLIFYFEGNNFKGDLYLNNNSFEEYPEENDYTLLISYISVQREYLNQSTWLCLNFTINSISNCTTYEIYSSKILFDFINDTLLFEHIYIGNSSLDKNKFPNSFGRLDLEDFLNKNPSIIGNHRLSIKDVIRNEYRSTILQKIINTPGIHNNELLRQCNLQKGQLQWHLQILIQYGLIKKKKEGQFSLFFPSFISQDINQSYNILLIKSKTTMKVLDKIENNPGINPSMVASELEISRSSVKYHVDKLIQENIISHRRKGRNVELYLNGNDT